MPEDVLHHARRNALSEQQRGAAMPEVVEAHVRDGGHREHAGEVPQDIPRVEWSAEPGGEDVAGVLVSIAGSRRSSMLHAMRPESVHERITEHYAGCFLDLVV